MITKDNLQIQIKKVFKINKKN